MSSGNATILEKKYKNLVLQVSLTEVSFCIKDTLKDTIDTIRSFSFHKISNPTEIEQSLIKYFEETPELNTNFDEITVLHNNNLLTFVPSVLFDPQYLGSYLQYNTKVFESDFFAYDLVSNNDMVTVYIPYVNINNFLIDRFGTFNYKHSFTILVKKVLDFSKNIDEPQLYVHIQSDNFQIIAAKNQKLLLFNTFDYKTEADFIYYLLFATEQLNFNPETIQVKLFGTVSKESDLYQIAYKYIRNVSLFFDYNRIENSISQQEYLQNFIPIHTCE
ncbi:hypothetical protein FPKKA176_contig00020-0009 [Flavobacterium psychrophilum]|uniref:DUF3822 family protein n=1 Tax=Flavobacterium psychrophilum TaxID=96345 RepID=UPI0011543763|nr:DUF3822 family protein [Flavobacterium psychrophilum]GEJ49062.1 hypothetical protein FPKKA176_contig00020-0009 [Flavobacterium psychrophilum]